MAKKKTREEVIADFRAVHGDRYDYSNIVYYNNRTKVSIICPVHGEFQQTPNNHRSGIGCSKCGRFRKSKVTPDIWLQRFQNLHGARYTYLQLPTGKAMDNIEIICGIHGPFTVSLKEHANGKGCPTCEHGPVIHRQHSSEDTDSTNVSKIVEYIKSLGVSVESPNRDLIPPHELDIFVPEAGVAIRYCGLVMNSDDVYPDKNYHSIKTKRCYEVGIDLLTIFEDEWLDHPDVVKSIIKNRLGKSERGPGARKLTIKNIETVQAKLFLKSHHIQGYTNSAVKLGAFNNDELVAVMLFGTPTRQNSAQYELKRFATDGKSYPGLANKLFKHFTRKYDPQEIVSFSDARWFLGGVYLELGFEFDKTLPPDYTYIKRGKRYHKSGYRKGRIKVLLPEVYDPSLTERVMMLRAKFLRIFDCGKVRWLWLKQ